MKHEKVLCKNCKYFYTVKRIGYEECKIPAYNRITGKKTFLKSNHMSMNANNIV